MPRDHLLDIRCWCKPEIHRTPDGIRIQHRGKNAPALSAQTAPYTPEELRLEIAHRITQHRTLRGLSQNQLAEISGLPQPTVNQIERQGDRITLENLLRICQALRVEAGEILRGLEIL